MYLFTIVLSSLIGAVFVSIGQPYTANLIWAISNPLLAIHNYRSNQKEQFFLFAVYSVIAWYGVINLGS